MKAEYSTAFIKNKKQASELKSLLKAKALSKAFQNVKSLEHKRATANAMKAKREEYKLKRAEQLRAARAARKEEKAKKEANKKKEAPATTEKVEKAEKEEKSSS